MISLTKEEPSLGFVAGIMDPTGLVKFGTRCYDPTTGRWTQQDPNGGSIRNPQTVNRYTYAGDDPIDNVDPTGQSWLSTGLKVPVS